MPGRGNLHVSPASALPGPVPCPELKPSTGETEPGRKLESEPSSVRLEIHQVEPNDDEKREQFGENGEGEWANRESPNLEPDPVKGCGYLLESKSQLMEANDGDERALKPWTIGRPTASELGREWSKRKMEQGIPEFKCFLPFLMGAPKLVQCGVCQNGVFPEEKIVCSIRGCGGVFHQTCVKESLHFSSSKQFKCPQHACFLCNQKNQLWRCKRCPIACHDKCAPFLQHVIHLTDRPGEAICWRHPTDWLLEEHGVPTSNTENIFPLLPVAYNGEEFKIDIYWKEESDTKVETDPYIYIKRMLNEERVGAHVCLVGAKVWWKQQNVPSSNAENIFPLLPVAYNEEEFRIDISWKEEGDTEIEPDPYVHIKRNVYLIKRKRKYIYAESGCTNCSSTRCSVGCVCRLQCISCSKVCLCSKNCANRPFQKEKKVKLVKTQLCGWGVVAAELINNGDFIIEYVGEVIDDFLCERRLWNLKKQGAKNFYMCEITKDFVIDATLKGNTSRFLNHSCDPNCKLDKWQVDGEVRVGVFACRSIEVGEPLTYDYQFVQFGEEVECHCGTPNCHGNLGSQRKIVIGPRTKRKEELGLQPWGLKRQRTTSKIVGTIVVK